MRLHQSAIDVIISIVVVFEAFDVVVFVDVVLVSVVLCVVYVQPSTFNL